MAHATATPAVLSPSMSLESPRFLLAQNAVAALSAAVIGSRFIPYTQISVGYLLAFVLAPVWIPPMWKVKGARWLIGAAVAALVSGFALGLWNSRDHQISRVQVVVGTIELLGVVATAGCLFWVARTIGVSRTLVFYGVGMLAFVNQSSNNFGASPWRFGYSLPITIIVLGLATWFNKWWAEMVGLLVLCAAALLSGARSTFAILAFAVVMLWVWRGQRSQSRGRSTARLLLWAVMIGIAVYNLTLAFNLEGLLGDAAQSRTEAQVDAAGNLLLGGRPELGATIALMLRNPLGFGLGVVPNWYDIQTGRAGMLAIGYDPLNGYVDNYMFGGAFRVHSILGVLWITWGLAGVLLTGVLLFTAIVGVLSGSRRGRGDAITLFLSFQLMWDSFFSPWYSSIPSITLLLPLVWIRSQHPPSVEPAHGT